jgi:microcystin-dependent protein
MILQQLDARITRSVTLADSDVTGADTTLPTPAANQLLGWDDDGLALVNYVPTDLEGLTLVSAFVETIFDDADGDEVLTTLGVSAYAQTLLDDASASAARTTLELGSAAVEPTTTFWSTGDVKITLKTTADTGWVLMNDGTIGNGSSGATTRANADTAALFALLWNNTADAQCAVSTGRGANAAADFAANKTIALPTALGRALAVYGAGSGLTSRALALATGAETVVLTTDGLPASGLSAGTLSVTPGFSVDGAAGGAPGSGVVTNVTPGTAYAVTGTTGNMGAGNGHANVQPTAFLNVMVKL